MRLVGSPPGGLFHRLGVGMLGNVWSAPIPSPENFPLSPSVGLMMGTQSGEGGAFSLPRLRAWELCESEVAQSCLTLCNPMDCSLCNSSIHGIFQARVLEWVAISFSRGSFQTRDQPRVSCIAGKCFNIWAMKEALGNCVGSPYFAVTISLIQWPEGIQSKSQIANNTAGKNRFLFLDCSDQLGPAPELGRQCGGLERMTLLNVNWSGSENRGWSLFLKTVRKMHISASLEITDMYILIMSGRRSQPMSPTAVCNWEIPIKWVLKDRFQLWGITTC